MKLDELKALAEKATPYEDWLSELFADQWRPRTEEYLRALSPERVLALIACIEAADAMRMSHAGYNRSVDNDCNDEMRAIRYVYDSARAALEQAK